MIKKCIIYTFIGLLGMQPYMAHTMPEAAAAQTATGVGYIAGACAGTAAVAKPLCSTVVNILKASGKIVITAGHVTLLTAKLGINGIVAFSKVCESISKYIEKNPREATAFVGGVLVCLAYQKYSEWSQAQLKKEFEKRDEKKNKDFRKLLSGSLGGYLPWFQQQAYPPMVQPIAAQPGQPLPVGVNPNSSDEKCDN